MRQRIDGREAAPSLALDGTGRRASARRLEADEAAAQRGNSDRTAAVGGVGEGRHARRDRRARAAARAAGGPAHIPGIAADAERFGFGDRGEAKFGRVGLGDEHQSRLAITGDEFTVGVARHFGEATIALAAWRASQRRGEVLEQERHAGQRAGEGPARRRAGAIVKLVDDGVERRVASFDPGDRFFDQFDRRDLSAAH